MKIMTNRKFDELLISVQDYSFHIGFLKGLDEGKVYERKKIDNMFKEDNNLFYYKDVAFINKKLLKEMFETASTPEDFCEWLYKLIY